MRWTQRASETLSNWWASKKMAMCGNSEHTRVLDKVELKSRVADNPQERPELGILRDLTPSPKRKRIGNTKLAYVAGILDGEGHFVAMWCAKRPNGVRYPNIRVAITNTNTILLKHLKKLFGGTVQKAGKNDLSRLQCYYWRPENTKEFLKLMKPYVMLKRRQLEVALAFYSLPYGSTEKKNRLAAKISVINRSRSGEDKVQVA